MELKRGWQTVLHALFIDANCIRLQSNLWTFDWLPDWLSDWQSVCCLAFHFGWYALIYIFYIICIKCENSVSASWQFLKFESRQCCRCYRRCCCCCCWKAIKADSVHCWLANRTETIRKAARQRVNSIKFPRNCLTNSRKSRTPYQVAYQTSNIYTIYSWICHGIA